MVLAFGRSTSLTSLMLVLSTISALVRSQAPGDTGGHTCIQPAVPDGQVRLLDSGWYSTLLSSESNSAGWTQTPSGSWTGKGSFCTRRLVKECNTVNAWVVTQYVNKTAVVNYAMEITVEVEGDSSANGGGTVKVHYYPSNEPIATNAQLVTSNYNLISSLTFYGSSSEQSVTFSLGSQYDRFYIAIEASCFTLRGLKVSYYACQRDPMGLVIYPDTPIGTNAETVSAKCKANAIVSQGSSLDITCKTDGTFTGSPSCSCDGGYFESGESCHPCAANYFAVAGAGVCSKCPSNSHSKAGASECDCNANFYKYSFNNCSSCPANSYSLAGSDECTCENGYYRTSKEGRSYPCTTAPTNPGSLTISSRTDTSVNLTWTAPTSDGGRAEDLFYIVQYKILGGASFKTYDTPYRINKTNVTVTGLDPVTTYIFAVIAQNNVTVQFPGAFPLVGQTSNEATITTTPSPPVILNCSVEGGTTMVWKLSPESLSDVTGYEISITGSQDGTKMVPPNIFHYFPTLDNFTWIQDGSIELQVRGVNSGGSGEWSNGVSIPFCAYDHVINPPENCLLVVDECPTNEPPSCPKLSCPTSSVAPSPSSDSLEFSLDGYLLYTVAGVVVALYVVLIVILVILCCYMKFRKKDYYITQTKNVYDTELITSAKV